MLTGTFETMSMAELIHWARSGSKSGSLELSDGESDRRIELLFGDGRIIWSATSSSRFTFSSYLVHLGLCSEADVGAAMMAAKSDRRMLGEVLVERRQLDRELAVWALTDKIIEDLCDVFLWPAGDFFFRSHAIEGSSALAVDIDPIKIVVEGQRRRSEWKRLQAHYDGETVLKRSDSGLPANQQWRFPVVIDCLAACLDGQRSLAVVCALLPFSVFSVYASCYELEELGLLGSVDDDPSLKREVRVEQLMREARIARSAGRWVDAMRALEAVAAENPGRNDVFEALVQVANEFRGAVYEHNFTRDDVPVLTLGDVAVVDCPIDQNTGFVLSRIDGKMSIGDIVSISPMEEIEVLRTIKSLLETKLIDFPRRLA